MPKVSVSLGMTLVNYPVLNKYNNDGSNKLTWNGVAGATYYFIGICSYNSEWDLNDPKLTEEGATDSIISGGIGTIDLSSLAKGDYLWHVDAYYKDESGRLIEMTRGLSTFTY